MGLVIGCFFFFNLTKETSGRKETSAFKGALHWSRLMGLAVSWLATVWTEGLLVMRSVNSVFSGVLLSQGQDLQAAGKTIKADKTHTHTQQEQECT